MRTAVAKSSPDPPDPGEAAVGEAGNGQDDGGAPRFGGHGGTLNMAGEREVRGRRRGRRSGKEQGGGILAWPACPMTALTGDKVGGGGSAGAGMLRIEREDLGSGVQATVERSGPGRAPNGLHGPRLLVVEEEAPSGSGGERGCGKRGGGGG